MKDSFTYSDWGVISYDEALKKQTDIFEDILDAKKNGQTINGQLIFCEHNHVLTLGVSGKSDNLLIPEDKLRRQGVSFVRTNRGGDITYHGPGQITAYPILDLDCWGIGLKQYIHRIEDIVIDFLALYGIKGERLEGGTGVWIDAGVKGQARKICAIGVKSSRFVTMHGFGLNINTDLSYFSMINPCGFVDKGVTSLAEELGSVQDIKLAKERLRELFLNYF
jgi:lipoate-protein ligase B